MPHFIAPTNMADSYTCPFCDTTSIQEWFVPHFMEKVESYDEEKGQYAPSSKQNVFHPPLKGSEYTEWAFAQCAHCRRVTVWHSGHLVFPESVSGIVPNEDMPDDIKLLFIEADSIYAKSPRASAALLRLALQELLNEVLGDKAESSIFENTKLVQQQRRCSEELIKAMDIIRYEGNESVHPGEINLNDNADEATYLFVLLNMICYELFSAPKRLKESYALIPGSKRSRFIGAELHDA